MSEIIKERLLELKEVIETIKNVNEFGINEKRRPSVLEFATDSYFPLLNGKKTNVLGLALEMNCYVVAKHILLHNDYYKMDIEKTLYDKDENPISALDIYYESLEYFKDKEELEKITEKRSLDSIKNMGFYAKNPALYYLANSLERNIIASLETEDLLKQNKKVK